MRSALAILAAALVGCATTSAQTTTPPCHQYPATEAQLETPCNLPLRNATGYQVRIYNVGGAQQAFSNAAITAASFDEAQGAGFQANFRYIEGANEAGIKIPMTGPVLTRSNDTYHWDISFFVPASLYPTLASIPAPTPSSNVTIVPVPRLIPFAVAEFGGFATETDFLAAEASLRAALARDGVQTVDDAWGVAWAQYDSPYTVFNRHNEVWVHIALQ